MYAFPKTYLCPFFCVCVYSRISLSCLQNPKLLASSNNSPPLFFFFLVFLNASHYICIVFVLCWSSQLWPYRALSLNNTTRYSLSPCHCLPPCVSADYTDLSNVTVISFSFSWSDIFDFVPGHVISASQSSVWKPCREMYSGYHTFKDFWKVHIWQSIYLVLMPDYFPP